MISEWIQTINYKIVLGKWILYLIVGSTKYIPIDLSPKILPGLKINEKYKLNYYKKGTKLNPNINCQKILWV